MSDARDFLVAVTDVTPRRIGPYEVQGLLGEGGIGQVYAARDTLLGRQVAIKALRPEMSRDRNLIDRFYIEAKSLANLNHPNITTLYALQLEGQDAFMVMELVRGNTLNDLLARVGRFSLRESRRRGAGGGRSRLRASHGVIHRDIKPSNLMVTDEGVLKIMDFGIARVSGSQQLTRTGDFQGTLAYASPEQIRGERVDERSDLYSLAIVLYKLLAGVAPFDGIGDYALMTAHLQTPPPPLRGRVPELDVPIEEALMQALAKRSEDRFASVAEFGRTVGAAALRNEAVDILQQLSDRAFRDNSEATRVIPTTSQPQAVEPPTAPTPQRTPWPTTDSMPHPTPSQLPGQFPSHPSQTCCRGDFRCRRPLKRASRRCRGQPRQGLAPRDGRMPWSAAAWLRRSGSPAGFSWCRPPAIGPRSRRSHRNSGNPLRLLAARRAIRWQQTPSRASQSPSGLHPLSRSCRRPRRGPRPRPRSGHQQQAHPGSRVASPVVAPAASVSQASVVAPAADKPAIEAPPAAQTAAAPPVQASDPPRPPPEPAPSVVPPAKPEVAVSAPQPAETRMATTESPPSAEKPAPLGPETPAPAREPEGKPDLQGKVTGAKGLDEIEVNSQWVRIYGIRDRGQNVKALLRYLAPAHNVVVCYRKALETYRCYADGQDIARLALQDGSAQLAPNAPTEYRSLLVQKR
jgi:serine/threonine protein kinase